MAIPALIDLTNYDTFFVQSTQSRTGVPDGNVFFNLTSGKIEFIPAEELATLIYPVGHPNYTTGLAEANPLTQQLGIRLEAAYAFENQERSSSVINGETLRAYDRWLEGNFKFGGAYLFVNGRTPSTSADRAIIRSSGWEELNIAGVPLAKYFGNKGLSNIELTSQPYYQQTVQGSSTNFAKTGQIDEAILVYQDLDGNGIPDIDFTTYEAVSIRTYGQNHDRKETTNDLGLAELGGYFTGFALDETPHLTTLEATYPIANVYNATRNLQVGVWLNMELQRIAVPAAKVGEFSDETGTRLFTWELVNPNGANLDEIIAWLDAFALNSDEADGLGVTTGNLGKDVETWYSYNAAGQVVTKSGVTPASEGLYIQNIPTADQQRIVMTDNGNTIKTYSFQVSVEAEVGIIAKGDVNAWYHSFFAANYNSASAVEVQDSTPVVVKGAASIADVDNKIIFSFDYTGDTLGGTADTDKNCVFLVEGDGGATQAKTLYTITKQTTVAFACSPTTENNV